VAVDDSTTDAGVARAGTAVAVRRVELGISQRELARKKVITAAALIAFEKGRAWPRERTRATLEELLHWPAGTIAQIRAGAPAPGADHAADDGDASLVVDAVDVAVARFDDAISHLPAPVDAAFPQRATALLAELSRLERIAARAVRHSQGSPAVIKALSTVRQRYHDLMLQAATAPGATLGQRLYAARRRANLSTAETAAAMRATAELVEALEAGEPVDAATAARIEALISELSG
jgi:transcriptional regulator with XRE-family HTH domain